MGVRQCWHWRTDDPRPTVCVRGSGEVVGDLGKVAVVVRSEWDRREGMKFNDPILDRSHHEGEIIGRHLIHRIGMVTIWCVFLFFDCFRDYPLSVQKLHFPNCLLSLLHFLLQWESLEKGILPHHLFLR